MIIAAISLLKRGDVPDTSPRFFYLEVSLNQIKLFAFFFLIGACLAASPTTQPATRPEPSSMNFSVTVSDLSARRAMRDYAAASAAADAEHRRAISLAAAQLATSLREAAKIAEDEGRTTDAEGIRRFLRATEAAVALGGRINVRITPTPRETPR